jgi:hypothetical protein
MEESASATVADLAICFSTEQELNKNEKEMRQDINE